MEAIQRLLAEADADAADTSPEPITCRNCGLPKKKISADQVLFITEAAGLGVGPPRFRVEVTGPNSVKVVLDQKLTTLLEYTLQKNQMAQYFMNRSGGLIKA